MLVTFLHLDMLVNFTYSFRDLWRHWDHIRLTRRSLTDKYHRYSTEE